MRGRIRGSLFSAVGPALESDVPLESPPEVSIEQQPVFPLDLDFNIEMDVQRVVNIWMGRSLVCAHIGIFKLICGYLDEPLPKLEDM